METHFGLAYVWHQGDWVIRGTALALLGMSIATWVVIVLKALHLRQLRARAQLAQVQRLEHDHHPSGDRHAQQRERGAAYHPVALVPDVGQSKMSFHACFLLQHKMNRHQVPHGLRFAVARAGHKAPAQHRLLRRLV